MKNKPVMIVPLLWTILLTRIWAFVPLLKMNSFCTFSTTNSIFSRLLCQTLVLLFFFTNSSKAQESTLQGKFVDNLYVVQDKLLDEAALNAEQKKCYQQQLKILKNCAKYLKVNSQTDEPRDTFRYKKVVYIRKNGDYYHAVNENTNYWISPIASNMMEFRQNENQKNAGRTIKVEIFNKQGKVVKTIYPDKVNPCLKYKNSYWGYIDLAELHSLIKKKDIKNIEGYDMHRNADSHLYNFRTQYSNGYLIFVYNLYSMEGSRILGSKTIVLIFDKNGAFYRTYSIDTEIQNFHISSDGQYLLASHGFASQDPLHSDDLGYFQIYSFRDKKIIHKENGTKEYPIVGFVCQANNLYFLTREWSQSKGNRNFTFYDLDSKVIYNKTYTKEEINNGIPIKNNLLELFQYNLFNQTKI